MQRLRRWWILVQGGRAGTRPLPTNPQHAAPLPARTWDQAMPDTHREGRACIQARGSAARGASAAAHGGSNSAAFNPLAAKSRRVTGDLRLVNGIDLLRIE